MDKYDKEIAVEDFIKVVSNAVGEVELLLSFLNLNDEKEKKAIKTAMSILNKKISKVKKSENLEEANKYIKIKKVIKNYSK